MTSPHIDVERWWISEAVNKWNGSAADVDLLISYRVYDIRKWLLVQRMLKRGNLTKSFFRQIRNRPYIPPTKKQLIEKLKSEALRRYENIFYFEPMAAYGEFCPEERFDELFTQINEFEDVYRKLLALDSTNSLAKQLRTVRKSHR